MADELANPTKEKVLALMKEEGNSYDFMNAKTGYPCLMRRSPTSGAWCGYVSLPKDHPFHDLSYDDLENMKDVELDVHGGITFSDRGVFGFDCSHYGDYYIMGYSMMSMIGQFATDIANSYERTMAGDKRLTYKTKEYVIKQTNSLAEQFYSYKDMVIPKKLEDKQNTNTF